MTKLFKQIGDEVIEYTEVDYAQAEMDKIEAKKFADKIKAEQAAKDGAIGKLAALGLTADDLKALGLGGN
jgi:hypothetical protein